MHLILSVPENSYYAKKEEIQAYIKARSKIGYSLKFLLFTDLLMCRMTRFVDGNKIDSVLIEKNTQIRKAKFVSCDKNV